MPRSLSVTWHKCRLSSFMPSKMPAEKCNRYSTWVPGMVHCTTNKNKISLYKLYQVIEFSQSISEIINYKIEGIEENRRMLELSCHAAKAVVADEKLSCHAAKAVVADEKCIKQFTTMTRNNIVAVVTPLLL